MRKEPAMPTLALSRWDEIRNKIEPSISIPDLAALNALVMDLFTAVHAKEN